MEGGSMLVFLNLSLFFFVLQLLLLLQSVPFAWGLSLMWFASKSVGGPDAISDGDDGILS